MPTEALVPANGIELCYETFGDPSQEPLLLVMGLGAQLTAWPVELCDALVDRGFFVIRYDNRDVGRSTKVDEQYLLSDMAADAAGLLDALGVGSAHVVGASMGGMIAQAIAIEHPDRVRSLTSIMSTTGDLDVGQPTPTAMERLMQPPPTTRDEAIDAGVESRRVIGSPEAFDEVLARKTVGESYDRCWYPAGTMRQLLAITTSGSRADGLRNLTTPTLVVHGDVDPLVTPSGGQRTAELVPGATLLMLEGMGHDLPPAYLGPIVEAITALAARANA